MIVVIALGSALMVPPLEPQTTDRWCTIVHFAPDGRRTQHFGDPSPFGVHVQAGGGAGNASAASRPNGSRASAVSASASTQRGARSSSSTSTVTGSGGRTVTTQNNSTGCTVVIDDRPADRRD